MAPYRYDLLCIEGIQLALNIFNGRAPIPTYKLVEPANGQLETITVKEEVRTYFSKASSVKKKSIADTDI